MRRRLMTLTFDDYAKLTSLLSSKVTRAFSDPILLRQLHQELSRARLVAPEDLPDDVIALNSTMTLRDCQTQALETYTLVSPVLADIANRRLSVLSPAGAAVLGHRVGDEIDWPVGSGWRLMKVEKVTAPIPVQSPTRV